MDSTAWNDLFRVEPSPWGPDPAATVRGCLEGAAPGYAIDLACGDGRHARWLRSRGWDVTAVDFSPVAIDGARRREYGQEIDWQVADITEWAPARAADLVLVAFLHLPVHELVSALGRAARWLRDGGRMLYLGHARENHDLGMGGPPDPRVLPDVHDLAVAATGLRVDTLGHVLRDTSVGTAVDVVLDARTWPAAAVPGEHWD